MDIGKKGGAFGNQKYTFYILMFLPKEHTTIWTNIDGF